MVALFKRRKNTSIIAIDITPSHIYMIEASGSAEKPRLNYANSCPVEPELFREGIVNDQAMLTEYLQPLLSRCHSDEIILGIDPQWMNIRTIQIDKDITEEDIEENVIIDLERGLNYSVDEAYFDFVIKPNQQENHEYEEVLIYACRKQVTDVITKTLEDMGYKIRIETPETIALANLLQLNLNKEQQEKNCGLFVLTDTDARLITVCNELILFADTINYEVESPEECAESLISLEQAENMEPILECVYLCGAKFDIPRLEQDLENFKYIELNPFQSWGGKKSFDNKEKYIVAAALALEGLS